ncbi:MAG: ribose 5-phosphate isomerase B [bacterium]|nr:ribose 5-phosphate isomerase B [bacterium]
MRIALGADHGGFRLKEEIKRLLLAAGHEVTDAGCTGEESVDYPDYAALASRAVSSGACERGILVCTSGIGMSIAANKVPGVRAALCLDAETAELARRHNDSNVLVLAGGRTDAATARGIVERWLAAPFDGGRHARRVGKIGRIEGEACQGGRGLAETDPEVWRAVEGEVRRQCGELELIASENFASLAVLEAAGSVLTNKYAEGYPAKRYYDGCEHADEVERLAVERAKALFGAEHANVQPHSGTQANMAVYFAVLSPGDTILSMDLAHGGHLSMGHPVNFSGKLYRVVSYGVRRDTERIDYDEVERAALACRPKLLIAGASAYPCLIDYERFARIAARAGCPLMADMAHVAGLVAAGCHPSPVPHADFVTTTTHKTLRGPRGGMILCRRRYAAEIDRAVFPGMQGGPLMHVIAAKAVALREAMDPRFAAYARRVTANAAALAAALAARGHRLVSGGTDNHLVLVDLTATGMTGRDAAAALHAAGITVNKNMIPFDPMKPTVTSGIRLGTPAVTTRGMREPEMERIAELIHAVVSGGGGEDVRAAVRGQVADLCRAFPLFYERVPGA